MVRWETATFAQKEKFLLSKYSPSSTLVSNRVIEPFYLVDQPPYVSAILNTVQKPWSSELQGRNVLVVHPFSETIVSQYNKHRSGKHLFRREDVLPSFTLKTVKTFMTLAGAPPPHGSWTETLEATKRLIDAMSFQRLLFYSTVACKKRVYNTRRYSQVRLNVETVALTFLNNQTQTFSPTNSFSGALLGRLVFALHLCLSDFKHSVYNMLNLYWFCIYYEYDNYYEY